MEPNSELTKMPVPHAQQKISKERMKNGMDKMLFTIVLLHTEDLGGIDLI